MPEGALLSSAVVDSTAILADTAGDATTLEITKAKRDIATESMTVLRPNANQALSSAAVMQMSFDNQSDG